MKILRKPLVSLATLLLTAFISLAASPIVILKKGTAADGYRASAAPIPGPGGWLYGTFAFGGLNSAGTLYRMTKDGAAFTKLFDFKFDGMGDILGEDGYPTDSIFTGSDGKFYGALVNDRSLNSRGSAFRINADGSDYDPIFPIDYDRAVHASLFEGSNGRLYYVSRNDIITNTKSDNDYQVIHAFKDDFGMPSSEKTSIFQSADGRIYGIVTYQGDGTDSAGIFAMNPDGEAFSFLKVIPFKSSVFLSERITGAPLYADNAPVTPLIEGNDGRLYGGLDGGLVNSNKWTPGYVFRINKNGTKFEKLRTFDLDSPEGSFPLGGLTEGADGRLYGDTARGGKYENGVIFSMRKDGGDYVKIADLPKNVGHPLGALVQVDPLVFVGAAIEDGRGSLGTIFKVDASAPRVLVKTRTPLTTRQSTIKISGRVIGLSAVRKVEYRVGSHAYHKAKGTRRWSFKIALHAGRNVISIRAVDTRGRFSTVEKAVVTRT